MPVRPTLPAPHRLPLLWLLLASGLTALYLWQGDHFAPVRDTDAVSYEQPVLPQHAEHDEDLADEPVRLALASTRTLFYPAFLELVRPLTPDYGLLPRIHWLLFTLAVLYLWYATAVFSASRWLAVAVALPLLFPTWLEYVGQVMPEALAATFAVASFASLLLLARRPSSPWAWIGLTLATLLGYHTKPVLQVLVVLLPLLAPVLRLSVERRPRSLARWTLGVAAATTLPLLLYCTLRLAVVGQFGLVAFTGYNVIGFTATLLDEELVASLPDEHRALAQRIVEERDRQGRPWHPAVNQWDIAEPAAREIVAAEIASGRTPEAASVPINLAIDRRLLGLSKQVVQQRPRRYLRQVARAFRHGFAQIFDSPQVRWLIVPLLVSLAVAGPVALWRRRAGPTAGDAGPDRAAGLLAIGLIAVGFYVVNLALIALVSWPLRRYLDLAGMMLPSALAAAIWTLWATAVSGLGAGIRRRAGRWEPSLARFELALAAGLALALGGWWLADRVAPMLRAERIWIESGDAPAGHPVAFFAARDFWFPAEPASARLLIDTDAEYRVLVNGALVGSDRGLHDELLDSYAVGDLLRRGPNRLVVELRSVAGPGAMVCRLDAELAGRRRRTLLSDGSWFTVDRFSRDLLRPRGPVAEPRPAAVLPESPRWGLRPGPRLPRADELLSTPATVVPRRMMTGLRGGTWQHYSPEAGSSRTRVTFDWGEQVAGFLNLEFGELPAALVYLGAEQPDPRLDRARALAHGFSATRTWTDTRPRRFRYATVVSTVRVRGAWVDALKPELATKTIAEVAAHATERSASPLLEETWHRLERASRQSGQTRRIIGRPARITSTSSGSPIRQ